MIRVYSGDYERSDYRRLLYVLSVGLDEMKKTNCSCMCDNCSCKRVCHSIQSTMNYLYKRYMS